MGPRPVGPGARGSLWIALGAAAVVAVIAVVMGFVFLGRNDTVSAKTTAAVAASLRAAGCTFKTYPSQGRSHLAANAPPKNFKYDSFPPVSGPHYQVSAVWNFYSTPLSQVQQIHNLEHGGIVVQWGSKVPQSTVDELRTFWESSPYGELFAPLPRLGDKIAIGAWTHLGTCTGFREKAFTAFRDAYRLKGPERGYTPDNTQPGA